MGINYVLHCVEGSLEYKIDTLLNNLENNHAGYGGCGGYTLFGATVICDPLHINTIAEYELMLLNSLGIFNNNLDTYDNLSEYLLNNKIKHKIDKKGYVALFSIQM